MYRLWHLRNEVNRHQAVRLWLSSLPADSSLLDAGAGIQYYKKYATHLRYTSQDFGEYKGGDYFGSRSSPTWDSTRCDFICDITSIPVPNGSFDAVLCTEVFEHLPDPQLALSELARVLKPGGSMFLTAPFRSLYHQTPYYFYSGFSRYWYYHFAQLHGLCIQSLEPNGSYFSDIAQELDRILKIIHPFQIILLSPLIFLLIVYLFLLEYLIRVEAPESCWGYHVVLVKLV